MPIDSLHPEYTANLDNFIKSHDTYEGSRAIKNRTFQGNMSFVSKYVDRGPSGYPGDAYLPRLKGMTPSEYNAYKERALFHNVAARAADGMVGVMTRLPPELEGFEGEYEKYEKDFSNSGISLREIIKQSILEILLYDRVGFLVDAPANGGDPVVRVYDALNITNWDVDEDGIFTYVVIKSVCQENSPDDKFEKIETTKYFELHMDDNDLYAINVWVEDSNRNGKYVVTRTLEPTIRGRRIDYIPFIMVNSVGINPDISRATLLDIIEINLSHYRTSADLEHGRHFTALPTPVITGISEETKISLGSTEAIALSDPQANAFFLEFKGEGLRSLETAITEKERQMATMSARLIDQNRKGSEAADTVRLRYSGESNTLGGITDSLEAGINWVLKEIATWKGDETPPKAKLNRDFMDDVIPAQTLKVLMEMYLEGAMDVESFIYNMKRSELFPPGKTDEEYKVILANLKTNYRLKEQKPAQSNQPTIPAEE